MFNKEHKNYITEEDASEVICIRNNNGLDNDINDIFAEEIKDEKGRIIRINNKRETINYEEFSETIGSLPLRPRTTPTKRKTFRKKLKKNQFKILN